MGMIISASELGKGKGKIGREVGINLQNPTKEHRGSPNFPKESLIVGSGLYNKITHTL